MRQAASLCLLLLGCGDNTSAVATRALGMNDISMLVPLPAAPDTPVLLTMIGDGTPLVPRDRFDALVVNPHDIAPKLGAKFRFEDFHVVAVRFDLCVHDQPEPCRD